MLHRRLARTSTKSLSVRTALLGILATASLAGAQFVQDLHVSSPSPITTSDPVVLEITGVSSCQEVFPELYPEDQVVEVPFTGHCPILPPEPVAFVLYHVLQPLTAGIWEIRVADVDSGEKVSTVVTVLDPRFDVTLSPSPATVRDEVTAFATVFGSLPQIDAVEVSAGSIRIFSSDCPICDPPPPAASFVLEESLGRLAAGDYLVELRYGAQRVAERTLTVRPAGACVSGPTTLCLTEGRFRTRVTWTAPGPKSGPGHAVPETDESGLFWFFNPGNVELIVKVLDACDTAFESFWVFAAGLTNVGVTIEVTDSLSGESVLYQNPEGRTFETITDTSAFLTCP